MSIVRQLANGHAAGIVLVQALALGGTTILAADGYSLVPAPATIPGRAVPAQAEGLRAAAGPEPSGSLAARAEDTTGLAASPGIGEPDLVAGPSATPPLQASAQPHPRLAAVAEPRMPLRATALPGTYLRTSAVPWPVAIPAPVIPAAAPPPPATEVEVARTLDDGGIFRFDGVNFDYDRAALRPAGEAALADLAKALKLRPGMIVEVGGHTDSVGNADYNLQLSMRRADAVVDALVRLGIERHRLRPAGYGETRPVDLSGTAAGDARNRRVDVVRIKG